MRSPTVYHVFLTSVLLVSMCCVNGLNNEPARRLSEVLHPPSAAQYGVKDLRDRAVRRRVSEEEWHQLLEEATRRRLGTLGSERSLLVDDSAGLHAGQLRQEHVREEGYTTEGYATWPASSRIPTIETMADTEPTSTTRERETWPEISKEPTSTTRERETWPEISKEPTSTPRERETWPETTRSQITPVIETTTASLAITTSTTPIPVTTTTPSSAPDIYPEPFVKMTLNGSVVASNTIDSSCSNSYQSEFRKSFEDVISRANRATTDGNLCVGDGALSSLAGNIQFMTLGNEARVTFSIVVGLNPGDTVTFRSTELCAYDVTYFVQNFNNWRQPIIPSIYGCPSTTFNPTTFDLKTAAWSCA